MGPRFRVVSDNDYAGFDPPEHTADHALREIRTVRELLGRDAEAVAGSNRGLGDAPSAGARVQHEHGTCGSCSRTSSGS